MLPPKGNFALWVDGDVEEYGEAEDVRGEVGK